MPTDEQSAQMKRRGGRPKLSKPKEAVTVRYDADILEQFRASGDGWQGSKRTTSERDANNDREYKGH